MEPKESDDASSDATRERSLSQDRIRSMRVWKEQCVHVCATYIVPALSFWRGGHAHIRSRVDSFRRVKDLENNLSDELPKRNP